MGFIWVFFLPLTFLSFNYFAVGVFSFLLKNFSRAPLHCRPFLGFCRAGGGVRRPSHNGRLQGSAQSKQAQPGQPPLQVAVIVTKKIKERVPYRQLRSCLDPRHKDKQKTRNRGQPGLQLPPQDPIWMRRLLLCEAAATTKARRLNAPG